MTTTAKPPRRRKPKRTAQDDPRDPHYQPTQAEMNADISIPDATPEQLAAAIFRGVGQPSN